MFHIFAEKIMAYCIEVQFAVEVLKINIYKALSSWLPQGH